VWVCPPQTTQDEIDAIVVALNFEDELKEPWPEYIKARVVVREFEERRQGLGRTGASTQKRLKEEVAEHFALPVSAVTRYMKMVDWADDFEQYHIDEKGKARAEVRHKTNDIFQWFYEIDAGRGNEKLTKKLDGDDNLKELVYDLMYDVLDSGLQVRTLHTIVEDPDALLFLQKAVDTFEGAAALEPRDRQALALQDVEEAIQEVKRKGQRTRRTRLGFDSWLRDAVDRLGNTPPDYWQNVNTALLVDLQRVMRSALGAVDGVLRGQFPLPEE